MRVVPPSGSALTLVAAYRAVLALIVLASVAGAQGAVTKVPVPLPGARQVTPLAAPQGVTASLTPTGVRIAWQGVPEATQYLVLRAPNAAALGAAGTTIATVTAGTLAYNDNAFRAAATYQVVAVAADGRRASSATVAYAPPAAAAASNAPALPLRPQVTNIRTTALQLTGTGAPATIAIRTGTLQLTGTDVPATVAIRTGALQLTGTGAPAVIAIRTSPLQVTGSRTP